MRMLKDLGRAFAILFLMILALAWYATERTEPADVFVIDWSAYPNDL